MKRLLVVIVPVLCVLACRGQSSTPSTPTTPPPGGLTGVSLTGLVTAATIGPASTVGPLQGAIITILDGPNAGKTGTTDEKGAYSLNNLAVGNANVSANAPIYDEIRAAVAINGTNTLNFNFPIPPCLANNTGRITFRNASPRGNEDFRWDGAVLATLAPGQTSDTFVTGAGVHILQVMAAGTTTLVCSQSAPNIVQCSKDNVFTCAGP